MRGSEGRERRRTGTSGQFNEEFIVLWCGNWELDFGERGSDFGQGDCGLCCHFGD